MPVDTPAADYAAQAPAWRLIRDLIAGRANALRHVWKLPGHSDEEHAQFKARAYYLPALMRTVETFGGLCFLRPPIATLPASLDAYRGDVTLTGMSLDRFAEECVDEALSVARGAILVDFPQAPPGLTRAQAEAQGLRAFMRLYRAEDILGTRFEYIGGVRVLTQVRLRESVTEPGEDEWTEVRRDAVRVCEFVAAEGQTARRYVQRLFVKDKAGKWTAREEVTPLRNGAPLDRIPIVFFSHRDHDPAPIRPPLADLADMNVSHLNDCAGYQWALMLTASPTPVFKGWRPAPRADLAGNPYHEEPTIRLGGSEAILLGEQGDAFFLEFSGAGLNELRTAIEAKRRDMAAIGARILMDDPRVGIAAETARIQRAGENSVIAGVAQVVGEAIEKAFGELALWAGVTAGDGIRYKLNRNFLPSAMTPDELRALIEAVQAGALSRRDLFARLQAGELIDAAKRFEEHLDEVEEDGAALLGAGEEGAAA